MRTPITRFSRLGSLGISEPVTLVADAFYACRTRGLPLLASGSHLVSRVRKNAAAYRPASHHHPRRRGRPRLCGAKIRLRARFGDAAAWLEADSRERCPARRHRDPVSGARGRNTLDHPRAPR